MHMKNKIRTYNHENILNSETKSINSVLIKELRVKLKLQIVIWQPRRYAHGR